MRIALSALTSLCLQPPAEAKQQQPTKMMKIGEEIVSIEAGNAFIKVQGLLNNKQFEQASALLTQFLESYPNSSAALYKYGFVLLQQGKDSEALAQAKRCTELKPNFFGGWALLGEASMNLKLEDQAKEAYQKALAIQSTGENADIIREHLNEMTRQKEVAIGAAEENEKVAVQNRVIMKLNSALALCDRANALLKEKQFEQGFQVCRDALKAAPDSAQIKENVVVYLNNYAADCVQKQNLKQAEALMKEALALQSNGDITPQSQKTTLRNYSALLKYLGRNDEAKQIDEQMKTVK
jgi:tetratricopeptide (TPR) repeat protein